MKRVFLSLGVASSLALQAIPSALYIGTELQGVAYSYNVDLKTGLLEPNPFFPTVSTGTNVYALAITPDGTSVYVTAGALDATNVISMFSIDPTTGYLFAKTPPTVPTFGTSFQSIVSPNGKFFYTASNSASRISAYTIDPISRVLTQIASSPIFIGQNLTSIAMPPDGKSLYVANSTSSNIYMYDINQTTGALTPKSTPTVNADGSQTYITVSPDGSYAYAANNGNSRLYIYSIDPVTGILTFVDNSINLGSFSFNLAISPNGKNLYAVMLGLQLVKNYLINPNPTPGNYLTLQGSSFIDGVGKTMGFTLDSKFAFLTVSNSGTQASNGIFMYIVDPDNGDLTPNDPAVTVVPLPNRPSGIAVTPAVPVVEVVNTAKALSGNVGGQFGIL